MLDVTVLRYSANAQLVNQLLFLSLLTAIKLSAVLSDFNSGINFGSGTL